MDKGVDMLNTLVIKVKSELCREIIEKLEEKRRTTIYGSPMIAHLNCNCSMCRDVEHDNKILDDAKKIVSEAGGVGDIDVTKKEAGGLK